MNLNNDGKVALAARGFGTFKRWARENRKAAARFRQGPVRERERNAPLAEALDAEYERLIRPNLN